VNPFRILVLAVLLYVLYRLLTGGKKRGRPSQTGNRRESQRQADLPSHDVLVQDPVCHIYIPKGQAVVLQGEDKSIYFCSEKCREVFVRQKGER